jgi:O-antigen ligase
MIVRVIEKAARARKNSVPATGRNRALGSILKTIVGATVVLVPVWVSYYGYDPMRLPKLLLFHAAGITLIGVMGAAALMPGISLPRLSLRREEVALVAAVLLLTVTTTLFSTNRLLSLEALLTAICAVAFFLSATLVLRRQSLRVTIVLLGIPSAINAVVVVLQALRIWNPFASAVGGRPQYLAMGLQGNPNMAGTFLVAPAVALLAFSTVVRGLERAVSAAAFVLVAVGVVLTGTLTAELALATGCLAVALLVGGRPMVRATLLIILAACILLALFLAWRSRVTRISPGSDSLAKIDRILSGRVMAFTTAVEMIRDRPLAGVGPGCFEWQYMRYNERARKRYPSLHHSVVRGVNFGEAHNELLQYGAETGLPGMILFVAALVLVARRRNAPSRFVRRFAIPFTASLFVVSLAQFPFRLAAPTIMNLYLAALCLTHISGNGQSRVDAPVGDSR